MRQRIQASLLCVEVAGLLPALQSISPTPSSSQPVSQTGTEPPFEMRCYYLAPLGAERGTDVASMGVEHAGRTPRLHSSCQTAGKTTLEVRMAPLIVKGPVGTETPST